MPTPLSNEKGSVMLFTLMFILIITVMGLIATQTSVFEIKIAENAHRYSEEFAGAEAALNHAIANFRNLPAFSETVKETGVNGDITSTEKNYAIEQVLNDTRYNDYQTACYKHGGYPLNNPTAVVEIRRIVRDTPDVPGLSTQANNVPKGLPHRYYAGSIDKRRFAVTATAFKRKKKLNPDTGKWEFVPSSTWAQKGISLPAEQDRDVL